jgi:hypothetical protein
MSDGKNMIKYLEGEKMKLSETKDGDWFMTDKKEWYKRIGIEKDGYIKATQVGKFHTLVFHPDREVTLKQ